VLLLDAPRVLGWTAFRDLASRYGLALTEQLLQANIDAAHLPTLPVRPFAHVLLGALQEAAFATAAEPQDRASLADVVHTSFMRWSTTPRGLRLRRQAELKQRSGPREGAEARSSHLP